MGYGLIVSGGTDGLYQVELDFGTATRDAWVAAIDGWIERLNIQIANAEAALIEARNARDTAGATLQALIGELVDAEGAEVARLQTLVDLATQKFAEASARADAVRIPREMAIAERDTLAKRKGTLLAAEMKQTLSAWCTDLTPDASGYVGTIEIPGEDQSVLIAPGGRQPLARDGILWARELLTPEQAFFNAAILPGWQKWKPTYRKATILAIAQDEDKADVEIDPTTSSANRLNVNQATRLQGVPVQYMECDAAAFVVGDRVVVEFQGQDWKQPKVIGFVEAPKPCLWVAVGSSSIPPASLSVASLLIESLRDGVIERIYSGFGVSIKCWLDGEGPYELNTVGGVLGSYFYFGEYAPGESGIRLRCDPIRASDVPGYFAGAMRPSRYGYLNVFLGAAVSTPELDLEALRWSAAELVIHIDGKKELHIAVTEARPPLPTDSARVKGVPIKQWASSALTVSKFSEYVFVGG